MPLYKDEVRNKSVSQSLEAWKLVGAWRLGRCVTQSSPPFDLVLARVVNVGMTRSNSLLGSSMYNSNIPLEYTQLNDFRLNPHYVILYSLISGKVTSLAFSNVQPAALATHAFNDFPLLNRVLAVDSSLLHDTSHVDSIKHVSLSIKKILV